jgi:hypothetical protein
MATHTVSEQVARTPAIPAGTAVTARKHVTPKWVDGLLFLVLIAFFLLACFTYIPMLWGWSPRTTWLGQGSWSMAKEGGVMPCSLFHIARSESYQPGDIISFWYKDPARPGTPEESTIKRVVSVRADGTLVCRGDNQPNSDREEYNVPRDKVRGRVVGWRLSLIPVAYWRWLSMGWTLQADEIALRTKRAFSIATAINILTSDGRWRNRVELSNPPSATYVLPNAILVSKPDGVWLLRQSAEPVLVSQYQQRELRGKAELHNSILAVPCERELVTVNLTDCSVRRYPNSGHVSMARWMDDTHICVRMLMTGLMSADKTGSVDSSAIITVR